MLARIAEGRTDLVFDYVDQGHPARSANLIQTCAYFGDVSAIKYLLAHGEALTSLGENFGLGGASFHGHWRLCQFLLESGADANQPEADNGETPLHAALCSSRPGQNAVLQVLLAHGANPNAATKPGVATGGFMRDARTKAETPLHRAAAFADEAAIQLLLDAGAARHTLDMNGDSPLSWGSWHLRPDTILRLLLYGDFHIRPGRAGMDASLRGKPLPPT